MTVALASAAATRPAHGDEHLPRGCGGPTERSRTARRPITALGRLVGRGARQPGRVRPPKGPPGRGRPSTCGALGLTRRKPPPTLSPEPQAGSARTDRCPPAHKSTAPATFWKPRPPPRVRSARCPTRTPRAKGARFTTHAPGRPAAEEHSATRARTGQSAPALHKANPASRTRPPDPIPLLGRLGPPTPAQSPPYAAHS